MYKKHQQPQEGDTIVVWFSNGAASTTALKQTIAKYGERCHIRAVNNPVIEEHEDNVRFKDDVSNALNIEIESAINSEYPLTSAVDVWTRRKYMSGPAGAPCTVELKKNARKQWEKENHHDWLVLGFTADEKTRHERFSRSERENIIPVLIEDGITKGYCYADVVGTGLKLPEIYNMGYPNANCIGCVKASSPTYWNHVRKMHPDTFEARAEQSRQLGAKLALLKGKRVYLDELPANAKGRPMKDMNVECSIFCGMER